jgi:hypothetical protein
LIAMTDLILLVCVAACPLVMGAMLLMMARGRHDKDKEPRGGG